MAQTIKLKRSATSGATPTTSQLELGEVAINTYDGKMYIKKNVGGTESIVEIGGSAGSSTLSGLSDVTISSAAADQLLQYNGSEWVNVSIAEASAIMKEYQFTATAGQSTFSGSDDNSETLSYTAGAIQVFLNGIFLDSAVDYTATNGTSVVLSETVDANDYLQVVAFKKKIGDGNVSVNTFTGDNSTTAFTLSVDPGDENNTRVFIDGVYQSKDNYSVSGTTLTFSTAPPTSTAIEVEIGNRVVTLDTLSDLDLPDDVKLRLGTSQDLQIYHDGSHSYIDDAGTGGLYLRSDNFRVLKGDGSERMIQADDDGAVLLYYDGSAKIQTSNDGVTVTGDVEATGEIIGDLRGATLFKAQAGEALTKGEVVYISGVSGNTTVVSKADADDASKMPAFGLVAASASSGNPVDIYTAGILADIDTSSFSEGDELFVSTTAGALTATAPTGESAALQKIGKVTRSDATGGRIFIIGAGRTNAVPNLDSGDIFIGNASNQAVSASLNTKIEDYLDGGTSTPSLASLVINGTNANLSFAASGNNIDFGRNADNYITAQTGSTSNIVIDPQNRFVVRTNDTERMRIDSSGRVGIGTTPLRVLDIATTTGGTIIHLTDDTTGHTATDGVDLQQEGTLFQILNREAGDIRFGTDNTERMRIDSSGNVAIGSTSTNALRLNVVTPTANHIAAQIENSNTADSFGLVVKGGNDANDYAADFRKRDNTNIMRIRGDGNVGIGTSSPSEKLTVAGPIGVSATGYTANATTANFGLYTSGSVDTTYLQMPASGQFQIWKPSTAAVVTVLESGNMGIGIATPAQKLHVVGTSRPALIGSDSAVNIVKLYNSATGSTTYNGLDLLVNSTSDSQINSYGMPLTFGTSSSNGTNVTERMRIDSSGKVGVGTTVPNRSDFNIHGANRTLASTTSQVAITASDSIAADIGGSLHFGARYDTTTTDFAPTGYVAGRRENATVNNYAGYLQFGVTQGNAGTIEAMRIDSSGNVGINQSNPARKLHVTSSGSGVVAVFGDSEANNTIEVTRTTNNASYIGLSATSAVGGIIAGPTFTFSTCNSGGGSVTERMRLTSSGNLGIGNTNPNLPLTITSNSGANGLALRARSNDDYSFIQFFNNAGSAVRGQIYNHNGNIGFTTGTDTSAGNDLYIKDGVGVGIGTTSPDGIFHVKSASGVHRSRFESASSHSLVRIIGGTGSNAGVEFYSGTGNVGNITADSSSNLLFEPGGTEKVRIDSSGRLLVGSTTSQESSSERFLVYSTGSQHSRFMNSSDTFSTVYIKNSSTTANTNQPFLTFQDTGGNRGNFGLRYSTAQLVIQGHGGVGIAGGSGGLQQDPDLFVNTSGNVGIGTTSPAQHFEVNKANARMRLTDGTDQINFGLWDGTNYRLEGDANRKILITSYHTDGIHLGTTGGSHMVVKGGNVTIGADNPLTTGGIAKLSVIGILSFGLTNSDMSYIRRQSAGNYAWQTYDNDNTGSIQLQPYGGNVGIGTTSPVSLLHIKGSGTYNHTPANPQGADFVITSSEMSDNNAHSIMQLVSVRQSLTTGSGSTGYLGFSTMDDSNNAGINDAARIAIVNEAGSSVTSATALSFWTNAGGSSTGAATERMRITSAGELQLTGNGVLRNQESGGNFSYLQQTSSDARLFVQYSQPLLFGTNNTERMRIDTSGNVTIGSSTLSADAALKFQADTGTFTLNHDRGVHALVLSDSDGTGEILRVDTSGNLLVGRTGHSGYGVANFEGGIDVTINPIYARGGGIYIGGVASANLLDDYEEGTWTPSMSGMGNASFTTYGRYTKVGNLVYVTGKIAFTGKDGTNNVAITGLPFAPANAADSQDRASAYPEGDYQNINNLIDNNGHFRITSSSTLEGVIDNGSGYTAYMSSSNFSSSGEFNFHVTYRSS